MTRFSIVACLSLIGIFHSCDDLDAQESRKSGKAYSATQDGITVQLEKITVDRILNAAAWFKAVERESKGAIPDELRRHLPARLVTFSVSVVGETKSLGVSKIGFVDGKRTVFSRNRFFSPPKWQPRLPNLVVPPSANGIETQHLLSGETQLSEIFPTTLEVKVTTADGKELVFVFEAVAF